MCLVAPGSTRLPRQRPFSCRHCSRARCKLYYVLAVHPDSSLTLFLPLLLLGCVCGVCVALDVLQWVFLRPGDSSFFYTYPSFYYILQLVTQHNRSLQRIFLWALALLTFLAFFQLLPMRNSLKHGLGMSPKRSARAAFCPMLLLTYPIMVDCRLGRYDQGGWYDVYLAWRL
jgi:hypothetical protein